VQIKKIKLQNFRQFGDTNFEFSPNITIITGKNAQGKTTILEAINLIINGSSPWTNENGDIVSYTQKEPEPDKYFRLEGMILDKNGEKKEVSVFHNSNFTKFEIEGKKTTRKKFYNNSACNVFSPEQIDLLMISPSKRREFLNNLICKIDDDYAEILTEFEKVLRQRNAYLKRLAKVFYDTGEINDNEQQFQFWTEKFAGLSAKLMAKRSEIINQLSREKEQIFIHYKPSLVLNLFEDMAEVEKLTEIHISTLMNNSKRDIALGHTNIGAHRDDWKISTDKDIRRFGSRGEKRVALGKLIFRTQDVLNKYLGFYPILLLDDISSELDDDNIKKLLSHEGIDKQQVILTTINKIDWLEKLFRHKPTFIRL